MTAILLAVVGSTVLALISNEVWAWIPALSRRLVRRAANRFRDPRLRDRYLEEWQAAIDDIPGSLTGLVHALSLSRGVEPAERAWHNESTPREVDEQFAALNAKVQRETARAEEMERLIAFGQAIARSLTDESIKAAVIAHIPQLAPNRVAWALARSEGQWRPLMNVGAATPSAQETAAKIALNEIDPPPGVQPEFECFPMIIAGTPVGVLGVAGKPALGADQRRILSTAAALLAVSLKNSELFRQVVETSVRDPLTGCVTRRHGMGVFQTELRRARRSQLPMSLIVFDLDHLKGINDRYGHLAGDAVLGAIGGRMNAILKGSDLKCRYGGELFMILLTDTPTQGAERVAETLRREIESNSIPWNDELLRVTASFGITAVTPGEMDPLAAIARADEALHRAKQDGQNCVRVRT